MKVDPAIEAIRSARKEISAALGHDPKRVFEHYSQMQSRLGDRLRHGSCEDCTGDYSTDRHEWLDGIGLDTWIQKLEAARKKDQP